jgi:hypothetical protein
MNQFLAPRSTHHGILDMMLGIYRGKLLLPEKDRKELGRHESRFAKTDAVQRIMLKKTSNVRFRFMVPQAFIPSGFYSITRLPQRS